jgi:hypothetical protein
MKLSLECIALRKGTRMIEKQENPILPQSTNHNRAWIVEISRMLNHVLGNLNRLRIFFN